MSHEFNDLSAWTIERLTESMASTIAQTPSVYRPIGRAIARALDLYLDAAFLASYGDADEAACLLRRCHRSLIEAVHIVETDHVTAMLSFAQAALHLPELPNFIDVDEEEA
jgi:hypothetical protein